MTLNAFTMPKWGIEMAEGTIAENRLEQGATIAKGDVIVVIETDKIANEVEADADATVYRVLMAEGEVYPVGSLLAVTGDAGHSAAEVDAFIDAFKPVDSSFEPDGDEPQAEQTAAAPPEEASPEKAMRLPDDLNITAQARALAESQGVDVAEIAPSTRRGRITLQDVEAHIRGDAALPSGEAVDVKVSADPMASVYALPGARKLAGQLGVDLGTVKGTGRKGRIIRGDVEKAAGKVTPTVAVAGAGGHMDIPFTGMRRTVAKRLIQSVQTVPHFYLNTEVDMGRVLGLRDSLKDAAKASGKAVPSVNDFVVKAVAGALTAVPDVNINVFDNHIRRFERANISLAVAVEGGLFTPVIRSADQLSLDDIAAQSKSLAEKARNGKLLPEDYKGGTFSVSNLGMYGIDSFSAIINPPEGAILAVGAIQRRPREHNHSLWFSSVMKCMMSCDHRAIDGALGARFLQEFKDLLENPARLVANI